MRVAIGLWIVVVLAVGAYAQSPRGIAPAIAITSCGQSSDAFTLSLLAKRMRLDHRFANLLQPRDLAGVKNLVVVIGGSVKGLAEAGTDERRESARTTALLASARDRRIPIVAVHVGGEARRGSVTDKLIGLVVSRADAVIITEAGNKDGVFTKVCRARRIPLTIVGQPAEVARELAALPAWRASDQQP